MANSITHGQIKKINSELLNDFFFDLPFFVYHGEKTVSRVVLLNDDKHYIKYHLMYCDERNAEGRGYTGMVIPTIHVSEWRNHVSHGLGKWYPVGEPTKRKMFSNLKKITKVLTEEKLKEFEV